MERELKPCPECGHTEFHIRPSKSYVSMPVSIQCRLCNLTVEMQHWENLVKFWNKLPRGSQDQRIEVIEKALSDLVNKLKIIHDDSRYTAVWSNYHIHGGRYTGPTYIEELKQAEQALSGGKPNIRPLVDGEYNLIKGEVKEC
jgi:hypothetical protein